MLINNNNNNNNNNKDLEVAHPQSGSSSTWFLVELEFGNAGFWGEGKAEFLEKNLSEQGREPTTNSTHIWSQSRDLNPGHIGGRLALSPLLRPLLPHQQSALLEELIYCRCGDLLPLLMIFTLLIILPVKLGTLYPRKLEWSPLWLVLNV